MPVAFRAPRFASRDRFLSLVRALLAGLRLTVLLLLLGGCPAIVHAAGPQVAPTDSPQASNPGPAQKGKGPNSAETRLADSHSYRRRGEWRRDYQQRHRQSRTPVRHVLRAIDVARDTGPLKPQILRQLVDERLRVQEAQRRKIVIQDAQIADAIHDIERRNNLPAGALRQKLAADGVSQRTLIGQIRAQLGWSQMLRDQMAQKVSITEADVAEKLKLESQQIGQTEYRLGEIFIPVDDPANAADAQRFAETVITQLHAGAPFPLVAAQFSQTQTALEGGELGWVQANQLDPEIARLANLMPVGAISNPVKVPGGFEVVNLQGKREIGRDIGTVVTMRQVFIPFTSPLDPQAPTEQQRQALAKARQVSSTVHGCEQMEQVAHANNASNRPSDPGEVRSKASILLCSANCSLQFRSARRLSLWSPATVSPSSWSARERKRTLVKSPPRRSSANWSATTSRCCRAR